MLKDLNRMNNKGTLIKDYFNKNLSKHNKEI